MPQSTAGLHHVTAICGPAQANVDFYVGVLRQRLVKKTVNFDDPGTYHLYYGDQAGTPGSILTFFPFDGAAPGRAGPGMASAVAYGAEPATFEALESRFGDDGMGRSERFGARVLTTNDPDGLAVEFVETTGAGAGGFHSVTLMLEAPEATARVLTDILGYREVGSEAGDGAERIRLEVAGQAPGTAIDLLRDGDAPRRRPDLGTIHHIAFRAADDDQQQAFREALLAIGMDVTPVIDRQYFNAIYFREPGGVLFEIATDPPGFAVDEPVETLGEALKLPERYEPMRAEIEARLPKLTPPRAAE
ncbi:MAG: ring-cleaving dioxygenase [Pseudomonadota bacterium]